LQHDAPAGWRKPAGDFLRRHRVATIALLAIAAALAFLPSLRAPAPAPPATARVADFGAVSPSPDARTVADWVARSGDNAGRDFLIVDKKHARLLVFDASARLTGSSPILLGGAAGDDTVEGIGERAIADVAPAERTTPAGRFIAERGRDLKGEDMIWVDYDAGVSMHRVVTSKAEERRMERLESETIEDNRISYGCINVPVDFYEARVKPIFAVYPAMVYVLPEQKSVQQVFGAVRAAPQFLSASR
jgi:hypothetical protein